MLLYNFSIILLLLVNVQSKCVENLLCCPGASKCKCPNGNYNYHSENKVYENTDLRVAYVVFRHGDRTPDKAELNVFPRANINMSIFYPFGLGALTNQGKQRAFLLGEYLRSRYKDFLSPLYLPDEITVRSTEFARTKMTALTVLAAMYPPLYPEVWNPKLNWQPIPYESIPLKEDELNFYESCPEFTRLQDELLKRPDASAYLQDHRPLLQLLSEKTGYKFEKLFQVFVLQNLLKSLENLKVRIPKWVKEVRSNITEISSFSLQLQFSTEEMVKLSSGVLMGEIINISNSVISSDKNQTKLHLYSAHDITVAGFLAGLKLFKPHVPAYGSSVALELRKYRNCNKYGVVIVYAPEAGGSGQILPIAECGGELICDYDVFVRLISNNTLTRREYKQKCYKGDDC